MNKVHPTSIIGKNVVLGDNVQVYAFTQIEGVITIGDNTKIGSHVDILGQVHIGHNVSIQSNVFIPGGVIIEDDVFIGPGVTFLNDKFPPSHGKHWRPVVIKKGAVIGGGVTILPGVTVHEKGVVGAGSVLTKDVPPGALAYGDRARIQGMASNGE